ncbi:hypothetical protein ES707_11332 [subsurface metagenome]
MSKFRKKPVIVDAFRLVDTVVIATRYGDWTGNPGDWLVTVGGEQLPCTDEIFRQLYEPADELREQESLADLKGRVKRMEELQAGRDLRHVDPLSCSPRT